MWGISIVLDANLVKLVLCQNFLSEELSLYIHHSHHQQQQKQQTLWISDPNLGSSTEIYPLGTFSTKLCLILERTW